MRPGPPPYDRSIVSDRALERSNAIAIPHRIAFGGLAWARRSGGNPDRRASDGRLAAAIALGHGRMPWGGSSSRSDALPPAPGALTSTRSMPPIRAFAREAERRVPSCPRRSWGTPIGHGCSAWRSLPSTAASSTCELFYCGSLLHDHGIAQPAPDRDFTLASADRTFACATCRPASPRSALGVLADAICVHTTPGVDVERDGVLGCYVQWGAMVDGAGLRIWDIAPANVAEIVRRHPRVDFKRALIALMRAEAAAVPRGRFGLLVRCGLPLAVRVAPLDG